MVFTSLAAWGADFLGSSKEETCAFTVQRDRGALEYDGENRGVVSVIMGKNLGLFKAILRRQFHVFCSQTSK